MSPAATTTTDSMPEVRMPPEPLPPAQPAFILRGHAAPIHALHFTHNNTRLLTADADGWVISWNLAFKRPVAVWRAHSNTVSALGSWGPHRVITHGRDNKLLVWQLGVVDEGSMEKVLPVDTAQCSDGMAEKQPWLLHALPVNSLNFCSFAMCYDRMPQILSTIKTVKCTDFIEPILLTVPNAVDSGGIDIFQLPTRCRAAVIHADRFITTGMVMALNILAESTRIQVAAGYESGHTMVFVQTDPGAAFEKLYCAQPHTQPILSMTLSPGKDHYLTSSADANIAKHPLPSGKSIWKTELKPIKVLPTKHSGQQGLSYRSDGKIFATAGWDSHMRVYSGKTMKELAVLKWHKDGCYATAFAHVDAAKASDATPGSATSTELPARGGGGGGGGALLTQQQQQQQQHHHPCGGTTLQERRDEKAQTTHWLAAGSKDGKVSLWDVY